MKKHKTESHLLCQKEVERLLKMPVLDIQRERRAGIIKDFSLARLKLKSLTINNSLSF